MTAISYSEEDLEEVRQSRLLIDRVDDWLFDEFGGFVGKRILEIGCGLGNHLDHFLEADRVVGIDVSESSIDSVREAYAANPKVRAEVLSITDDSVLELQGEQFDTAVSLNVFEHIEDDELAIANTHRLLEDDGMFILIVPAHGWLYGTMDSSIGHYRRYTKSSLRDKMQAGGFEVVHQKYINMLGAMGWLVNGRVLKRRVPPRGQLKLLNQIIPVARGIESVFPAPLGITVMSVARKVG